MHDYEMARLRSDAGPLSLSGLASSAMLGRMSNEDLIVVDPGILGGTPCIATTRLPVYAVAARFRAGEPVSSILDGYPDLTEAHVLAAVAYADEHPFVEHPDARPWRKQKADAAE